MGRFLGRRKAQHGGHERQRVGPSPDSISASAAGARVTFARSMSAGRNPNVIVTGTPGTGKTTTAQQIAQAAQLNYINVGDWVKEKELHTGWDEEFQCYTVDEDLVCASSRNI